MMTITTLAQVTAGTLQLPEDVVQALRQWQDGPVMLTIDHRPRTARQNKWYWSQLVGLVSDHTGYTPEEVHALYRQFLPRDADGEPTDSTTALTTIEFDTYCQRILQWAAEDLGVVIPDPP